MTETQVTEKPTAKSKLLLIAIIGTAVLLAGSVFAFIYSRQNKSEPKAETVHLHASFNIFEDNTKIDLAKLDYMHIEFCNTEEEQHEEDEQGLKAHLHDLIGDVVHVHRKGATWGDLITNLDLEIDKPVKAIVNGETVEDILNYEIKAYDRVLIAYGETEELVEKYNQVSEKPHVEEVEKMSESCGS